MGGKGSGRHQEPRWRNIGSERYWRDKSLRKKYSISLREYEKILNTQHGLCSLCHLPPARGRYLVVDHDHSTGKIRGLLHYSCNTLLGMAYDSPERLLQAIQYLARCGRELEE